MSHRWKYKVICCFLQWIALSFSHFFHFFSSNRASVKFLLSKELMNVDEIWQIFSTKRERKRFSDVYFSSPASVFPAFCDSHIYISSVFLSNNFYFCSPFFLSTISPCIFLSVSLPISVPSFPPLYSLLSFRFLFSSTRHCLRRKRPAERKPTVQAKPSQPAERCFWGLQETVLRSSCGRRATSAARLATRTRRPSEEEESGAARPPPPAAWPESWKKQPEGGAGTIYKEWWIKEKKRWKEIKT